MISRPLPRVRDGDVLSLGLVNQMIGRVEYVASLLKDGKPLAGNSINISENYDGAVISAQSGSRAQTGSIPWNTRFSNNGTNTMNGSPQLYPIQWPGWDATNAKYAVWVNPSQDPLVFKPQTIIRKIIFPTSSYYYFFLSADNNVSIYLDEEFVFENVNNVIGFAGYTDGFKFITAGTHSLKFVATNTFGGTTWNTNPAGYSVEIDYYQPWKIYEAGSDVTFDTGNTISSIPKTFTPPFHDYTGYMQLLYQTLPDGQYYVKKSWTTINGGPTVNLP